MAFRYDALYDELTQEQRAGIEETFRGYINYILHYDEEKQYGYWRGRESFKRPDGAIWDTRYTRTIWLPNMHYPQIQGAFMMALALQDEALIRACFATPVAGFKWWMDHYVADGRFYMEEFGKQYSTFGELLLWCRGCKRLGLDELGFGYVGVGDGPGHAPGATMRKYTQGRIDMSLPMTRRTNGTPVVKAVHMGDAGTATLISGCNDDGSYAARLFIHENMNGPAPRLGHLFWFEMAQKQWPEDGYDWVLANHHKPGAAVYHPSAFFDLDPIALADVKPPPVASFVAPERGFALLRMEEGPGYWESPRPVLALQFGMYYVHYVHDCFTLLHYLAGGRSVYGQRAFGPHKGYAGHHPWKDSVRGHNGVVVDSAQIQPVDDGDNGPEHTRIRSQLAEHVKFVSVFAKPTEADVRTHTYARRDETRKTVKALYTDCAVERAVFLTDAYLFDVFNLVSDRPRVYHWNHHPYGKIEGMTQAPWVQTNALDGGKLFYKGNSKQARNIKAGRFDLPNVYTRAFGDQPLNLRFARKDEGGVSVRMLKAPGTAVYADYDERLDLTTTIVERKAPSTAFVVLHEPREGDTDAVKGFEGIGQTDAGVAVRVTGDGGLDDRILLAYAEQQGEALTFADGRESFTFRGHAHVRRLEDRVLVVGNVEAMRLQVGETRPSLFVNGVKTAAQISDGVLTLP
jgi:hypothetical protein